MLAKNGSKDAKKRLDEEPEYPEGVEYLIEWAQLLHGRSGLGMGAVAPLSYQTIATWSELMDIAPLHPAEVEALVLLDGAMFVAKPEEKKSLLKNKKGPNKIRQADGSWPSRKN